jgi:hypothetical protein
LDIPSILLQFRSTKEKETLMSHGPTKPSIHLKDKFAAWTCLSGHDVLVDANNSNPRNCPECGKPLRQRTKDDPD